MYHLLDWVTDLVGICLVYFWEILSVPELRVSLAAYQTLGRYEYLGIVQSIHLTWDLVVSSSQTVALSRMDCPTVRNHLCRTWRRQFPP